MASRKKPTSTYDRISCSCRSFQRLCWLMFPDTTNHFRFFLWPRSACIRSAPEICSCPATSGSISPMNAVTWLTTSFVFFGWQWPRLVSWWPEPSDLAKQASGAESRCSYYEHFWYSCNNQSNSSDQPPQSSENSRRIWRSRIRIKRPAVCGMNHCYS